ncbi:MAG: lactate utilization protein [Candidatus Rokubacteria bacterium]|nr:lactate utilization protein [Candidatus Rokubacteria bacterium]
MTTRAEFLDRIRGEMRRAPGLVPAAAAARPARPRAEVDAIRRELAERWPGALEGFRREFEGVGGVFHRVAALADVPQVVAGLARERGVRRLVAWHPGALGGDLAAALTARGLDVVAMPPGALDDPAARQRLRAQIADAELGLTGADLAIAETGTLVLRSGGGRPRSTSLLPPYHVAVFDRSVLVESLRQAGVVLESWHDGGEPDDRGAVTSFITGPSRTADIELTLTRGVHGPKEVHAIFVDKEIRG